MAWGQFDTGSGRNDSRNIRNATVFRVMPKCLPFQLGLLPFVIVEVLQAGCGARSSLDEAVMVASSGGQSSTGGATGTVSTGNNGGNIGFGGSVSTGGSSTVMYTGCEGQPVAQPPISSNGQSGHCGTFTQPMVIGGVRVNVMETYNTGGAIPPRGPTPCFFRAPANIPLNVTSTGLGYRDPNNLSVWFELSSGDAEMFPNVQLSSDCTESTGGWYLDDNSSPEQIALCPCTCLGVIATPGTIYVVDFPVVCPFS